MEHELLTDDELNTIYANAKHRIPSSPLFQRLLDSYRELRDDLEKPEGPTLAEYKERYEKLSSAVADIARTHLGMGGLPFA
jgi:hypothetical protein